MQLFNSLSVAVIVATATLAPASRAAPAGALQNIQVINTPAQTRFVFDVPEGTDYHFFTLEQPARVVIDLRRLRPNRELATPLPAATAITAVRTGIQADGTLRYVFDLAQPAPARAFSVAAAGSDSTQIVVEIDNTAQHIGGDAAIANKRDKTAAAVLAAATPHPETRHASHSDPDRPPAAPGYSQQWSGYVGIESRLFPGSSAYPRQRDQNASIAFRPEYYGEWDDGRQQFSFIPFARLDSGDSKRSHADIRELYWRRQQSNWAVKAGIDVVFWGVTESQHLVDIINQTDLVENIDGEEKLGQPMLNLDYLTELGTWQVYLLPYFRERTFPGERGRLRTNPAVDVNEPGYQSGDKRRHIDVALRWSHYIGDWDIGVGYFAGTSREPLLVPTVSGAQFSLTPYYPQITQTSLDMQSTKGAWLWKLEAIYNQNRVKDYYAWVGGFEYTRYNIAATDMDLGWLLEFNYDQRGRDSLNALQQDIYFGVRLAANDIAGSSLLAGVAVDTGNHSTFINIEAARRLGELWTATLEARLFTNIDRNDPFQYYRADDYIGVELSRFF